MPADGILEKNAKGDENHTIENQQQCALRPVYHETMTVLAQDSPSFDNSVRLGDFTGNTESISFEIDRRMENMNLSGTKNEGIETSIGPKISEAKYETESGHNFSRIPLLESHISTPTNFELENSNGDDGEDDEEDEDDDADFELERIAFTFKKAEMSFKASDWARTEAYLVAVLGVLDSYPSLEPRLQGTDTFLISSILMDCQVKQGKWREVLKTVEIVSENAKTSQNLPRNLRSIMGTHENLKARAYKGLGELGAARTACRKAARMRRGDPERLDESARLMVEILGEMGEKHEVEAEFYRSLILQDKIHPLTEENSRQDWNMKHEEKSETMSSLMGENSPVTKNESSLLDQSSSTTLERIGTYESTETFLSEVIPIKESRLASAADSTLAEAQPQVKPLDRQLDLEELRMNTPEPYEKGISGLTGELGAGNLEDLSIGEILGRHGLKMVTDSTGREIIVTMETMSTDLDSRRSRFESLRGLLENIITGIEPMELAEQIFKHNCPEILNLEMNVEISPGHFDSGTPLHYAVRYNNLEIVSLLLKYGVNLSEVTTRAKYYALQIAIIMNADLKMTELLIAGYSSNFRSVLLVNTSKIYSCLLYFAIGRDISNGRAKIALLLKSGAEIDFKGSNSTTPLMASIYGSEFAVTVFLLNAGASVNLVDQNGFSALHIAAIYHNEAKDEGRQKIKLLLEYGADKNLKDKQGKRPIDYIRSVRTLMDLEKKLKPDPWWC